MSYSVHLPANQLSKLPPSVLVKLKLQLKGVADLAESSVEGDPVWETLRDSGSPAESGRMLFALEGFRVSYTVDRARKAVVVMKVDHDVAVATVGAKAQKR